MKSSTYLQLIFLVLASTLTSKGFGQVTPEKYYNFSKIYGLGIDTCIISRSGKDSVKRKDMVINYDRKKYKMTFLDQFNGSKVVFQFDKDSNLLTQEFFIKNGDKLENAGVDSFFYDSLGKKIRYHSIVKRNKADLHIRVDYSYRNDSLHKEIYSLDGKYVKTVLHTYDRWTNTEIVTTISDKEPSNNQYYSRDQSGKLKRFFIIELNGDTSIVHLYKYDALGRISETRTYDLRSNSSNIYRTYYGLNGLISREEDLLNIQFGDLSTAIYTCKTYNYRKAKR